MKRVLRTIVLFTLLAASVGVAHAAPYGISVNWGPDCWGDNPLYNITWACNSNTYSSTLPGAAGANLIGMTISYVMPYTKTNVVATDIYVEGATPRGYAVPDWWKMGDGECRGAPGVANVITLTGIYAGGGMCNDYYQGGGGGGLGLYSDEGYRMHINGTWAVADPMGSLGPENGETFAATYKIKTAKTVGADACVGCTSPVCWWLNYVQIALQGEQVSLQLGQPYDGGNVELSWHGGYCWGDAARPKTWGQLKSLYR